MRWYIIYCITLVYTMHDMYQKTHMGGSESQPTSNQSQDTTETVIRDTSKLIEDTTIRGSFMTETKAEVVTGKTVPVTQACYAITLKGTPCRKTPSSSGYCNKHENLKGHCASLNKDFQRCGNAVKDGEAYCSFHTRPSNACSAMTLESALCKGKRMHGERYCNRHIELKGHCAAMTQKGTRCKKIPSSDRIYCVTHAQYEPPTLNASSKKSDSKINRKVDSSSSECKGDSKSPTSHIYVLECKDSKFYVGKTSKTMEERFKEHTDGTLAAAWTKKYPPIAGKFVGEDKPFEEDRVTLEYMEKHGIDNVRGGSYSQVILPSEVITEITKKMNGNSNKCFKCGQTGHFIKGCPM